ncbi:DNA polymerase III subunit gamma and tau [Nocardia lijiangensis]|uniref:DNA polymerase III subunit gamma and tau n=1 Tax=Nocardia lijiangensis TaxID=299618 RepID=UPI003D703B3A
MALYRKYRPATFAEVVGQEHVTDPLSIALDTGRISHAYLFSGPRGCGKTSSARILARSLNCVQGPTSRPCGVCPSCIALGPGGPGNLDVIELDAASHGGVDDTRELRDRAFYAPAESRYRVFIVDEAHMVTTAGFNALLKIVEEPPAHLIFIFATTEPDKVLPTIRSRTHHYPFRLLPPATMRGLLGKICEQEDVPVEEAVYPLVIRAGGGSPRDSLSVLDQLLAGAGTEGVTYNRAVALLGVTDVALIDDAVEALAAADGAALFGTVDSVMEAGHDPRRFAVDLLERFRDLILLRAVPDAADRGLVSGPGDVLDRMRDQAQRIGPATLTRYAELLHEGLGEMRGATAPRLLLEVVCARMLLPSVSDTESAALQRLERLERGFAGGAVAPLPPAASPAADASLSADRAPARSPGDPSRRRGAEALAALRENKTRSGSPGPAEGGMGATGGPVGQGRAASGSAPSDAASSASASGSDAAEAGAARSGDSVQHQGGQAPAPAADAREDVSVHRPERADAAVAAASIAQQDGRLSDPATPGAVAGHTGVQAGQSPPRAAEAEGNANAPTGQPASVDAPREGRSTAAVHSAPGSVAGNAGARPGHPGGPQATEGYANASTERPAAAAGGPVESVANDDAAGTSGPAERSATTRGGASGSADRTGYEAAQSVSDLPPASGQVIEESAAGRRVDDAVGERAAASAGSMAAALPDEPVAALPDEPAETLPDEPAGAVGDDLLRAVEGAWTEIRAKVREFGPTVQALLSGASVARVDGTTIVFAHQHAPLAQRLSGASNIEAVRSAVRAVLGSDHEIRWEAGGAASRPAAQQSKGARGAGQGAAGRGAGQGAAGRGQGGRGEAGQPRFSRPSQARANAAGDAQARAQRPGPAARSGDDDIPPPDYPDLPDDPGPGDFPPPDPAGYESPSSAAGFGQGGVPGPSTPEEEREMLAEAAKPVAPEARHDPDEVALELLRSELGATRLDG